MHQIKHIKHKDIDFKKWNNTILSSEIPFVFAHSFYLNATCPNWDALVIGDYESVFPLTYKTKFGYTYLPQPPFTSQLGAYGHINQEIENAFYDYILKHYKLIDLELNVTNKLQSEFISPKNTYIINYPAGYKFNQNTKRNILKAKENDFVAEQVPDQDIVSLSKLYLDLFLEKELNLEKRVINSFNQLLLNSIDAGCLYTFKVTDKQNTIKALAHFISNGKHSLYLKGTNFDRADNSGSMHLLMDYAIEFFSHKSRIFDFGGGSNSQGLANFYKGLGGEMMIYSFLRINKLPWLIKFLKNKKRALLFCYF